MGRRADPGATTRDGPRRWRVEGRDEHRGCRCGRSMRRLRRRRFGAQERARRGALVRRRRVAHRPGARRAGARLDRVTRGDGVAPGFVRRPDGHRYRCGRRRGAAGLGLQDSLGRRRRRSTTPRRLGPYLALYRVPARLRRLDVRHQERPTAGAGEDQAGRAVGRQCVVERPDERRRLPRAQLPRERRVDGGRRRTDHGGQWIDLSPFVTGAVGLAAVGLALDVVPGCTAHGFLSTPPEPHRSSARSEA